MKKKVNLLIIIFISFIYLLIISNINGETLTGETVTGEVSAQPTNVSIQVIRFAPFLSILSPENKTYLKNESLLLNFTVTDEETVWYNFDNTANTTITSAIFFNISQGSHTLYMFANNSENNITSKNVTFSVNSTIFIISYDEYSSSTKGESTDFNSSTYEDIQNLSNIILEDTRYGKIQFNEAINVTNDLINNDNLLDLDNNTNISQNRIELNSTALPNFDKPATLYLYNLTFSNPRILRDGVVCPSSVCTFQSYSGGNLTFNVTQFTVYSAEETPEKEEEIVPSPGRGGGLTFTISLDEIIISLKQGEIKTEEITIKNERNTKISFSVSSDMGELINIREREFELEPKEEKTIFIDFIAKEDTIPELYLGNLFIESGGIKKRVAITIEIESKEALFDVRLNIPEKYLKVYPGEELNSEIEIFNIVETGKVNVTIEYLIKDEQNREIISEEDTLMVENQISFVKIIKIPENIEPGRYVLYTRVIYNEKVASASAWFEVNRRFQITIKNLFWSILIIILIFIIYKNRNNILNYYRNHFYYWHYYKSRIFGNN